MCRCGVSVSWSFRTRIDVRNQLNHDKEPSDGEIPVEPVELASVSVWVMVCWCCTDIMSLGANDPAVRVLPPQAGKAHKVLDDGDGAQQGGANAEDGVGR